MAWSAGPQCQSRRRGYAPPLLRRLRCWRRPLTHSHRRNAWLHWRWQTPIEQAEPNEALGIILGTAETHPASESHGRALSCRGASVGCSGLPPANCLQVTPPIRPGRSALRTAVGGEQHLSPLLYSTRTSCTWSCEVSAARSFAFRAQLLPRRRE